MAETAILDQENPGEVTDYVYKANTLEDLAEQMGIDPDGLVAEIARFNANIDSGADTDYNRSVESMAKIENPPFYGARKHASSLGTSGGLDIDTNAQVLDVNGEPIPRLYAVGCNASSPFGGAYPGGGSPVASGSVFSYIAVNHALGL